MSKLNTLYVSINLFEKMYQIFSHNFHSYVSRWTSVHLVADEKPEVLLSSNVFERIAFSSYVTKTTVGHVIMLLSIQNGK